MTITLNEKLKAAASEIPSNGAALPRNEVQDESISFRHLAQSGEFVQSIRSQPGYVTVVQESGRETFRDALLGRSAAGKMDIRAGAQEVHSSEVYLVESHEHLLKAATVRAALVAAGAPEADVMPLLTKLGLETAAAMTPRDLGMSALKRLGIACSIYARARILLYDRPFLGADPGWVERIAQLLLQVGENNARALIITGETQIPQAWKDNERVLVQDPKQSVTMPARPLNGSSSSRGVDMTAAREILARSLVTRPQSIYHQSGAKNAEAMKSEAIQNPNLHEKLKQRLGGMAGDAQVQREAAAGAVKAGDEALHNEFQRERKNTGTLTRVTGIHRLKHTRAFRKIDEMVRKVRGRISARPAELDMPPAARLLEFNKRRELQWGAAIFALAVLAMCLLGYLAR